RAITAAALGPGAERGGRRHPASVIGQVEGGSRELSGHHPNTNTTRRPSGRRLAGHSCEAVPDFAWRRSTLSRRSLADTAIRPGTGPSSGRSTTTADVRWRCADWRRGSLRAALGALRQRGGEREHPRPSQLMLTVPRRTPDGAW